MSTWTLTVGPCFGLINTQPLRKGSAEGSGLREPRPGPVAGSSQRLHCSLIQGYTLNLNWAPTVEGRDPALPEGS